MSTLATADLNSDSENDQDFVLPEPAAKRRKLNKSKKTARSGSASWSGSDTSFDDAAAEQEVDSEEVRRLRAEQEEAEKAERKRKAAEAFASLTVDAGSSSSVHGGDAGGKSATGSLGKDAVTLVKVKRARRFAGETIYEEVELPSTDPEAIRYIADRQKSASNGTRDGAQPVSNAAHHSAPPLGPDAAMDVATPVVPEPAGAAATSSNVSGTSSGASVSAPPRPATKGPPRRKPRQSLEAMSAALDKGKKMTTLEKSQMDWNNHLSSSTGVSDELANHRRAGGYLEKRDFLDRVGERRLESFDKQGTKR